MKRAVDRILAPAVLRSVKPLVLPFGLALALGAGGACGGKDKKSTTPGSSGSSGTVSGGSNMDPGYADPANMDPAAGVPMADPNDRPPERDEVTGGEPGEDLPPEIRPPGLDMPREERESKVAQHLKEGNSALARANDPDGAIRAAKAALVVDETSIEAMVLLAHGNIQKEYWDLAEDILLKAFDRGGKSNKQAFFLLGIVYENTQREEKAPIAYQNALTLDADYKPALMNLGVSHLRQKRFQDAVKLYERLTNTLGLDTAKAWTNLGSAYRGHSLDFQNTDVTMRNTLIRSAEKAYRRAISLDKNYSPAYYNMGLLYLDASPFPQEDGSEMDTVARLKKAKDYLDEYRRLPNTDQKLVDQTTAVAQKLLDREELLRQKQAERAAREKALEEKRKKAEENKNNPKPTGGDDEFGDFE